MFRSSQRRLTADGLLKLCTLSLLLVAICESSTLSSRADGTQSVGKATVDRSTKPASKPSKRRKLKVDLVEKGSSSKDNWKKAIGEFPFDKLAEDQQERIKTVMKSRGMFRRLPKYRFVADRDVYRFFAEHPEAAVSIWQVMEISKFQLTPTSNNEYKADAKDGTFGLVEVLYRTDDEVVMVCDGTYNSPFLVKPIKATGVLHLQATFDKNEKGQQEATHIADLFVSFPSPAVEAAAKLISPISNMMADRNFHEVSLFVRLMNLAMSNQPGWMERLIQNMDHVTLELKDEMLTLTAKTFVANRKRMLAQSGQEKISVEDIMQPLKQAAAETKRVSGKTNGAAVIRRIAVQPKTVSPQ